MVQDLFSDADIQSDMGMVQDLSRTTLISIQLPVNPVIDITTSLPDSQGSIPNILCWTSDLRACNVR